MSRNAMKSIPYYLSSISQQTILGVRGFPKTPCNAPAPDPDLWTRPVVCVSIHVRREEADVNTQECVIPFLVASRPLWENNIVREVTV